MKLNGMCKLTVAAVLVTGLAGLAGCGGKKEVKPESTPVAAVETPTPTPQATPQRYTVSKGDTLWGISGKQDVYGDNFQWPLIFKANRDQIQDPDVIEVGQDFNISHEFSQEDVAKAIDNAKKTPKYKHHTKPRKRLPVEY
jgi:LysM repeat protein